MHAPSYQVIYVGYHTPHWGELIEQGWLTQYVNEGPFGRMARMIRCNCGRRHA